VRIASIACIVEVEQPNGLVWHAIHMRLDESGPVVDWSRMDPLDSRERLSIPPDVRDFVSNHFLKMFNMPVERRQAYIDKCKQFKPARVLPGAPWIWQPCCLAEARDMTGGCTNCGAPCL
jgi:hypothetical protein